MKMNTRIAIAALTALAVQAVCADVTSYSQDFEALDVDSTPTGWTGDVMVTNMTRAVNTPSIGSAISTAASTKCIAVVGDATNVNAFAGASAYQVDFLLNVEESSDELVDNDTSLSDVQIAVAVGTNFTASAGTYTLPVYVYCTAANGKVWVETDATVTSGEWARVSLLFDYEHEKCRVSVNGVPAASSDAGYTTSADEAGSGAWYPFVASSGSQTGAPGNVGYFGVACVDDVVVTNEEIALASDLGTTVTIEGANVSVPLSYLNKWGVSKSTFGTATLDSTGMTVADKYLVGLSPDDGKCFEIKSVDMNSDGTQLQVKVSGAAPVENWYKIVLSSPAGAPLATLAYNGSAWMWTVGEAEPQAATSSISSDSRSGETTISVALPESIRGVSSKIRTEVVPAN